MALIENAPNGEDTNPASTKKVPVDGGYYVQLTNLVKNLGASIKTAYEGQANTNAFTDAEQSKLSGIEALATADMSSAEIKTAYEANANTNAFTDAEQTKLSGIEALADVTDATNVNAAGAVMESDYNAYTVLYADTDNTPAALTVGASTIVGRASSGGIVALSTSQVRGMLTEVNAQTGTTYTTVDGDDGKIITLSNASPITITIHQGAAARFTCMIVQKGAGQVTVAAGGTGNVRNADSHTKLKGQYALGTIYVDSNAGTAPEVYFAGNTSA